MLYADYITQITLKTLHTINFEIPAQVLSLNNAYVNQYNKKGKSYRVLSKEANNYKTGLRSLLLCHKEKLKSVTNSFSPNKHGIFAFYLFKIPSGRLLTKQGQLSSRRPDVDNCPKLVKDCLFEAINIDDRWVFGNLGLQIPSERSSIEITLEILALHDFPGYADYL